MEIENLPKIKGWIARDKTYELNFFSEKPQRHVEDKGLSWDNVWIGKKLLVLDCDLYPKLTWEDEPIEAELILKVASDALREDIEIKAGGAIKKVSPPPSNLPPNRV